jgi:hypothetical protein
MTRCGKLQKVILGGAECYVVRAEEIADKLSARPTFFATCDMQVGFTSSLSTHLEPQQ